MGLNHQLEPSFVARQKLVGKLYGVRLHVVGAATVGLIIVGGAAAWRAQDAVMLGITLLGCIANAVLLWIVSTGSVHSAESSEDLQLLERRFELAACAGSACVGGIATRALLVSNDAVIHLAVVALGMAAVATCLRNYFAPRLVPLQVALLLYPPAFAMLLEGQPVYWALAAGGLCLGYVLTKIAGSLYDEALASLRKDEALEEQNIRFEAAVANMAQGICMFDRNGQLLVCNQRYRDIYGFSAAVIKPGVTLRQVLEHSRDVGNHPAKAVDELFCEFARWLAVVDAVTLENDLGNGRIVSLFHQPLEGGGWVTTHEDITERKAASDRIAHLARHDALTDLPNRLYFCETLEEWLQASPAGERVAVFCLDLDRFKAVNDTLGHAAGDALLNETAERIRSCAGETVFAARFGGDEFAIAQRRLREPEDAAELASTILQSLAEPFDIGGRQITIGISIGIAVSGQDPQDVNKIVRNADLALYRAKAEGRNQHRFFDVEMDEWLHTRRHLEMDLRRALNNGELALAYQPVFKADTLTLSSFEALLRWHHPERGIILPSDFIPVAEETGLITLLGEWVIRTACAEASSWPVDIRVAVNLSPAQLTSPSLLSTVTTALAAAGVTAERLELEVTENVLLGETEKVLQKLHTLRRMGIGIVMDDFGTGYSSLSNLRAFPFSKIKIDRSFVADLTVDSEALAIVRAVRDLGRTFEMSVTAEGVETENQLHQLQAEGCDEVQGFLLGKPLAPSELNEFIDRSFSRRAA